MRVVSLEADGAARTHAVDFSPASFSVGFVRLSHPERKAQPMTTNCKECGRRISRSNREAIDCTIGAVRLGPEQDALVAHARMLASLLDTTPHDELKIHGEYRAALQRIRTGRRSSRRRLRGAPEGVSVRHTVIVYGAVCSRNSQHAGGRLRRR